MCAHEASRADYQRWVDEQILRADFNDDLETHCEHLRGASAHEVDAAKADYIRIHSPMLELKIASL
jgi:hypothetical protein